MKKDWFLIAILAFTGLLAAAAVTLFLLNRSEPAYQTEDTPAAAVHNYCLAVQMGDFERAYSYLADEANRPDYEVFRRSFLSNQLDTSGSAIRIDETSFLSDDEALVTLTVLQSSGSLLTNEWSYPDHAALVRSGGAWKITYLPYPYWGWDWYQPTIDPLKAP